MAITWVELSSIICVAPAHSLTVTPDDVYNIAKSKPAGMAAADRDGHGAVDLKSEMRFGPTYYAAAFDRGGKTNYLHTITKAFVDGRKTIVAAGGKKLTSAQRNKLKSAASVISKNWERVLAETTFKYAGSVYKDMDKIMTIIEAKGNASKALNAYIKHWGELKGLSLALQTGKNNLGCTASSLNRLVGFGPLMLDGNRVAGVDNRGNYVRGTGVSGRSYIGQMVSIQKLMISKFNLKAQNKALNR